MQLDISCNSGDALLGVDASATAHGRISTTPLMQYHWKLLQNTCTAFNALIIYTCIYPIGMLGVLLIWFKLKKLGRISQ